MRLGADASAKAFLNVRRVAAIAVFEGISGARVERMGSPEVLSERPGATVPSFHCAESGSPVQRKLL